MRAQRALLRSRLLLSTLAVATALSACATTNPKVPDVALAQDTAGAPGAELPVPVDENGNPLTPGQIAAAVEAGTLPPAALEAVGAGTAPGPAAAGAPGAPGAPVPGAGAPAPGQKPASSGTAGTAAGGPKQYSGKPGPGVAAKTINIGITLFKIGEVAKGFGSDADPGDTQAQAKAAVDFVNANGGIAGRKVVPIYHTFDLTRPGLKDGQSEQEACAKWTQDNKVFAVINITYSRTLLLDCLAKADVPGLHDGMPLTAAELAPRTKYWYSNSQVVQDRMATASTRVFCKRGLFGKGEKVGIQYFDDPNYKKVVDQRFLPELKACGVPKENVILQGAPRGGTEATAYVSRFKREGVKTVMFLGEASLYPLFFMRAAEDQDYRPKYGLTTAQTPALLLQDLVPPQQLEKAIGMGWLPTADVDAPQDPGPVTKANALCMDIQRKAGQDMSNRQAAAQAGLYCGGLWFLQQNMARAPSLNSDGLAQAVATLGNGFVSASTFGASFSATKHDGPSLYRDFSWPKGTSKSAYSGGNTSMP